MKRRRRQRQQHQQQNSSECHQEQKQWTEGGAGDTHKQAAQQNQSQIKYPDIA